MTKAEALAQLRAHEPDLRAIGIRQLSLFGSVARDEASLGSDVDLAAELDRSRLFGLMRLVQIEETLGSMLGVPVDLVTEPADKPELQAQINRDRVYVF